MTPMPGGAAATVIAIATVMLFRTGDSTASIKHRDLGAIGGHIPTAHASRIQAPLQNAAAQRIVRDAHHLIELKGLDSALIEARSALSSDRGNRSRALALLAIVSRSGARAEADRLVQMIVRSTRNPDAIVALAHLTIGDLQFRALNLAAADSSFTRAATIARAIGDRATETRGLIGLALTRERRTGPIDASRLIDSAIARAPDSLSLAEVWCAPYFGTYSAGPSGTDRIPLTRLGAALARANALPRLEARCLLAAGTGYWFRLNLDSAYTAYVTADSIARRAHDREIVGVARWRVGYAFRSLGQYESAIARLRFAAIESAAIGDSLMLGLEELNIGLIAHSMRDELLAATYARAAASRFDRGRDNVGRAAVRYLEGAIALAREDTGAARIAYASGMEWARRARDFQNENDMRLGLFQLAVLQHRWTDAERELKTASDRLRENGIANWERTLADRYASLAAARGDAAGALKWYGTVLGGLARNQYSLRYGARTQLALAHLVSGDLARAEAEIREADEELDNYRSRLKDNELRLHASESVNTLGAPTDGAERIAAALVAGGGADRLSQAFRIAETRRSRTLLDRLARASMLGSGKSVPIKRQAPIATLQSVSAALPDDQTALLEFIGSEHGAATSLLVITREKTDGYVLPRLDSLRIRIEGFAALIESGSMATIPARTLATLLVDRAIAELPQRVSRLLIIPDGVLHLLPFDALVMTDGRRLIERFSVGIIPSAAVAFTLWSTPRLERSARLLALADPQATTSFSDLLLGRIFAAPQRNRPLPGSRNEVRAIASLFPRSDVRVGQDASEAWLKRMSLDSFTVLHFATHALADDQSASHTALVLSAGEDQDGLLTVGELRSLSLNAELVMLSACATARGPFVGGEGVHGLAAAFIVAGARSVVATGWEVGDQRVMEFTRTFYAHLMRGASVLDALRATKLEALKRSVPPRDWAVFNVIGDPFTRITTGN